MKSQIYCHKTTIIRPPVMRMKWSMMAIVPYPLCQSSRRVRICRCLGYITHSRKKCMVTIPQILSGVSISVSTTISRGKCVHGFPLLLFYSVYRLRYQSLESCVARNDTKRPLGGHLANRDLLQSQPGEAIKSIISNYPSTHTQIHWACDYSSILGLKLIHVNLRNPSW